MTGIILATSAFIAIFSLGFIVGMVFGAKIQRKQEEGK